MEFRLNRLALLIGIFGTIVMLIYPPLLATQIFPIGKLSAFQGYFFIFEQPNRYMLMLPSPGRSYELSIDLVRLALQVIAWWLIALSICFKREKAEK